MPFGKYKGTIMSQVPVEYLHWYWHKTERFSPVLNEYIKRNKAALEDENDDLIWDV